MHFLSAIFLGLLTHVLAQSITEPAILTAAATSAGSAASGICSDELGLLSCYPPITLCPDDASFSHCACTNAQSALNCFTSYCATQLTAWNVLPISSDSVKYCNGGVAPATATADVKTTAMGTANGRAASATSKAGAERGVGSVPAVGGVLGVGIGLVGLFL